MTSQQRTVSKAGVLLPSSPASVPLARRFVADHLDGRVSPELRSAVVLVISEMATNAVLHAATDFEVRVDVFSDRLRVEVADGDRRVPVRRQSDLAQPGGLGMVVVEACATRWGVGDREGGKVVWAEFDHPNGAPSSGDGTGG
ncbi:MAG TPA: ATP-binding protein [Acidimicrobiales bacterium]|nr:ATP-binding protein [Acidimicrobiales bacterium]